MMHHHSQGISNFFHCVIFTSPFPWPFQPFPPVSATGVDGEDTDHSRVEPGAGGKPQRGHPNVTKPKRWVGCMWWRWVGGQRRYWDWMEISIKNEECFLEIRLCSLLRRILRNWMQQSQALNSEEMEEISCLIHSEVLSPCFERFWWISTSSPRLLTEYQAQRGLEFVYKKLGKSASGTVVTTDMP